MIVCFDIGGSAIKTATATSPADMRMLGRRPTPLDDFDAFVAALAGAIDEAQAPAGAPVAISITGVVDPADGVIKCANIPAVDGLRLADMLSRRLERPVRIANDADCFALAEAGMGAGRGHSIVFGAILGTGVGGGLVIDGRLVTGAGGFAGEWGHGPVAATRAGNPPVDIPRLPCGCGLAGCVDTIGGARGMERLHKHLHARELMSHEIVTAWDAGDAAATRTVEVQVDLLAGPLALVANVVGADIIPVGGGLANSARFVAVLDEAVRARILRKAATPLVVPGTCRNEPGLIGAALLGFSGTAT
ncbi:ROK family protein [Devosia nitrariae]|uniref:N-acetylglucosamine kinase n=1 Tax=Devosia nitrariae TaxID=2071872 RepID=A0ABQ5W7A9_9HYPH|nr:ROK family protein [Devosia nitrariae]GLQ55773.1 N-acetylglucosamine kinase [Devosia nitrariae]